MKNVHYFRAPYDIERGNGKPGYSWHNGYIAIETTTGHELHPPVTRPEAYAETKAEGATPVFHPTKEAAVEAAKKERA